MEIKRTPPLDLDSQGYDILTARFDVEGDLQMQIRLLQKKADSLNRRNIPVGQDILRIVDLLRKQSINNQAAHLLIEAMEKGLL